jgi:transposase
MQAKVSPERSAVPVYVGIDVCKDRLDVYIYPVGHKLQVSNDPGGLKKLKRVLEVHSVARVVMEATGKFHRAAHRSLHAGGFAVAVVNPLRARLFAQASGVPAKTDSIDCKILAILGESLEPDAKPPISEKMEELQELVHCRDAAVVALTALRNQLGATRASSATLEIKRQIRAAETAIENLTGAMEQRIKDDPVLARRWVVITSIPGIGVVTAAALIAGLVEIGSLSAKQAAMLVGLAPVAQDSGDHHGARHIRGGRPQLRRAIYMAALTAARCNPHLKAFYQRLIGEGKKPKVALTAVMRKLVVLANTLVAQNRIWTPISP